MIRSSEISRLYFSLVARPLGVQWSGQPRDVTKPAPSSRRSFAAGYKGSNQTTRGGRATRLYYPKTIPRNVPTRPPTNS